MKGGAELIEQYIELHGRRLYGLCLTLCADTFDADDLYQETWLKAYKAMQTYDGSRPFEAWITGICVNTYRDALRRRKRQKIFDGFATSEEKERALCEVVGEEPQDFSDLHAAIDRLPLKMRVTVILHYFHDFDESRTAAVLGIPTGTVKSRLHQAKKRLRKELENESAIQF